MMGQLAHWVGLFLVGALMALCVDYWKHRGKRKP